jgi:16S rRNA (adenine1518-N6/adenine1519-N6)-dimethyltransferase
MNLKELKNILKNKDIRPSKRFGQNFLINENASEEIIKTAELKPNDLILEIGPGTGVLTEKIVKLANKVVIIEKDRNMISILKERFKDIKNIEIIEADILKYQIELKNYKVIGNLPFYLTAPIIRKLLEIENQPSLMALIIQKEVGQRICVNPPKMNLLATSVQIYSHPEIISYIPKTSFWPTPKVDAAVIKIIPKENKINKPDSNLFFKIIKAGFSQPRKQLINNLSAGLKIDKNKTGEWLKKNNLSPKQRAETLNIKEWLILTEEYKVLTKLEKMVR